ncbi:MAG TPA: murein transglycosylase domain-containing protein, partial [Chitinivibrionales bacterium]
MDYALKPHALQKKMKTSIKNNVIVIGMIVLWIVGHSISGQQEEFLVSASQQNDFKEYKNRETLRQARLTAQWRSEYATWLDNNAQQFKTFKNKIYKDWGEYNASSNKQWVEYGKEAKSCSIVDFAKGIVTVEVLSKPIDTAKTVVKRKLEEAIENVLTSKGNLSEVLMEPRDSAVCMLVKPVLTNQVVNADGKTITPEDINTFAQQTVENSIIASAFTADSSNEKYVVKFFLAPDHLIRRMTPFIPLIKKYCLKYDLNPAHVLALIHTESYFNPMARSSENAIGLMQLVPEKGAREAMEFINNAAVEIPRAEYLYDPETNIELGCVYLYILKA